MVDLDCSHDSMRGVVASQGMWWCDQCLRLVVTWTEWDERGIELGRSRLATYDDLHLFGLVRPWEAYRNSPSLGVN